MQLDARFPLTPALSLGEREDRRPIRIGTVWCVLPKAGRRSKAGSPLRSAPALHRVELNRSGLVLDDETVGAVGVAVAFVDGSFGVGEEWASHGDISANFL